ncbi:hypothetical protein [Montanilutibacter psychrotolerans]|uniref:hypothetical protein n=1 Tax=Montanilutibacter psychrotolerans TaxID=1327343 RepID=UPI001CC203C3|nr:hypothetical protein [Lysobacter psychrotolerans]
MNLEPFPSTIGAGSEVIARESPDPRINAKENEPGTISVQLSISDDDRSNCRLQC